MLKDLFTDVILSILQGFSQIFPVSSSAHLIVYGRVLGKELSLERIIFFHLGSFLAILLFFRRDVTNILFGRTGWRALGFLLISFVTTALVGLVVKATLADFIVGRPQLVILIWIINGFMVMRFGVTSELGHKKISDLGAKEYIIIGLAQGVAAFPGMSRLGLTLGASLHLKMTWFEGVKLSFLLSLPTVLAANISMIIFPVLRDHGIVLSVLTNLKFSMFLDVLIVAVTFCCGLLALNFFSKFVFMSRRLLEGFGFYCVISGLFFSLYLRLL